MGQMQNPAHSVESVKSTIRSIESNPSGGSPTGHCPAPTGLYNKKGGKKK